MSKECFDTIGFIVASYENLINDKILLNLSHTCSFFKTMIKSKFEFFKIVIVKELHSVLLYRIEIKSKNNSKNLCFDPNYKFKKGIHKFKVEILSTGNNISIMCNEKEISKFIPGISFHWKFKLKIKESKIKESKNKESSKNKSNNKEIHSEIGFKKYFDCDENENLFQICLFSTPSCTLEMKIVFEKQSIYTVPFSSIEWIKSLSMIVIK